MKIVHVLPSLARGGGERLTIELANRQVDAGHEVTVIVGSFLPPEMTHGGLNERVKKHFITSDRGRTRYRAMLPWLWEKRAWLGSQDVLHCHLTYGALFGAAFGRLARKQRPAIVETYHAVGMRIAPWLKRLHAHLAERWDGLALMVDDAFWNDFASSRPGIEFRIIPVGVDASAEVSAQESAAFRGSLGIPPDALVVTTIGRLVSERLPRSYIPVFAAIAKELPGVHFLMGGEGSERGAIESDASAAGIQDRLHFPGAISNMATPLAMSELYVTANVGSVPGVAGLQAVAAGVPVIAVQLSPQYQSPADDWIWSSRDPAQLAAKALEILRSTSAAKALAERQAAHLEAHHSAIAMAAAYEDFYRAAIARVRAD